MYHCSIIIDEFRTLFIHVLLLLEPYQSMHTLLGFLVNVPKTSSEANSQHKHIEI